MILMSNLFFWNNHVCTEKIPNSTDISCTHFTHFLLILTPWLIIVWLLKLIN